MTRGRSHGNLRDRSLTDLSRLGTPAHASRCPNQRRNIMSTTEKDGIAGPKQDEDLRRNPGIGQSKGTTAAGEKVEEIEGDNTVEGDIENDPDAAGGVDPNRSEEHTSELQSLMRTSYAVFCLKKKKK